MVATKTIGISALIVMGLITSGIIGANFFDKPTYYCESRADIGFKTCDSLSKYGVENGKCTVDKVGFICKTGWVKVVDDRIAQKEIQPSVITAQQYECNQKECIPIKK